MLASVLGSSLGARALPTVLAPVCSNVASGVRWRITIDVRRSTVDGNQAVIGAATISWRDPADNRRYALDRRSGVLTVTVPSSTGGWILKDRCTPAG